MDTKRRSLTLKARLAAGETLYGLFLLSNSPTLAEIVGLSGYDYVVVDMEHGPGGIPDALSCLRALAATGTPAIFRVPELSAAWAKKALDIGPQGIMFPMIQSAREAELAVSYCRFPPKGIRGSAHTVVRASAYGFNDDYLRWCDDELMVFCQVESAAGVAEMDAIAAVEGVGCIQIGPRDLSASMGFLADPGNVKVKEILRMAEKRALAAAVIGGGPYLAGMVTAQDGAEELLRRGYNMVAGGADLALFRKAVVQDVQGFRRAVAATSPLGEEGTNEFSNFSQSSNQTRVQMDCYQRVEKPRPEAPINENEIRINAQGRMRNYITYATTLLQKENGSDEIVFKAMGRAISRTVMIVELIKRRIVGLHQVTSIGSLDVVDAWEPTVEGLDPLETTRHVSIITITLSKNEPDTSSIGYQIPIPKEQVKPLAEVNYEGDGPVAVQGRGRGGRGRGRARGNGPVPVEYVNGVFNNRGRGYGRGGGRGRGYQGRGRGGYGGQIDYQQEAEFFDAPPLRHPIPMPSRVRSYEGGGRGGYGGQFDYQQQNGYFNAHPYPMQGRGSFEGPPIPMQGQGRGRGRGPNRGRGRGFRGGEQFPY